MLRNFIIEGLMAIIGWSIVGYYTYHWLLKEDVDKNPEKDYTEQHQEKTYNRDSFEYKSKDTFYFEKEK